LIPGTGRYWLSYYSINRSLYLLVSIRAVCNLAEASIGSAAASFTFAERP
jgi:hypothetical protein